MRDTILLKAKQSVEYAQWYCQTFSDNTAVDWIRGLREEIKDYYRKRKGLTPPMGAIKGKQLSFEDFLSEMVTKKTETKAETKPTKAMKLPKYRADLDG